MTWYSHYARAITRVVSVFFFQKKNRQEEGAGCRDSSGVLSQPRPPAGPRRSAVHARAAETLAAGGAPADAGAAQLLRAPPASRPQAVVALRAAAAPAPRRGGPGGAGTPLRRAPAAPPPAGVPPPRRGGVGRAA